jgi:3-methylcrotonyl-CoA carboxylase alpha subunit
LKVASGFPIPKSQEELKINGHAIEARIYSEDPYKNFLPANGKLKYLKEPLNNEKVRIDSGIREKDEISIFYDPMIAKLVVWGKDRNSAIREMSNALNEYRVKLIANSFLN